MLAPKYVHLERVNEVTWRISTFGGIREIDEFLRHLLGKNIMLCESAIENSNTITKTTPLDVKLCHETHESKE